MRLHKKGMTIIEMMVVCSIIGILASIAILTLANTRKHAIATEAIVGLSSLKQAMKHYYAEHGHYQDLNCFLDPDDSDPDHPTYPTGINPGFLTGTYFQDPCYEIDAENKRIKCYPAISDHPYAQRLAEGDNPDNAYIVLYLDDSFYQRNVSCTGYKSE